MLNKARVGDRVGVLATHDGHLMLFLNVPWRNVLAAGDPETMKRKNQDSGICVCGVFGLRCFVGCRALPACSLYVVARY